MAERRKHQRFKINGRAFAYYETRSPKIAEIVDIGVGGVAFTYKGIAETVNQPLELEIILPDSTRLMEKLPCKTVSDFQIDSDWKGEKAPRRCSVAFSSLTETQKEKLAYFVDNYCWRASQ